MCITHRIRVLGLCLLSGLAVGRVRGGPVEQTARIEVSAEKPGIPISPMLYGTFFEEESHAGDGGLYAELIRNRDFRAGVLPEGFRIEGKELITRVGHRQRADEVGDALNGWSALGQAKLKVIPVRDECNQEGLACSLEASTAGDGIINSGYYGMSVEASKRYHLVVIARNIHGEAGDVSVELLDKNGGSIGKTPLRMLGNSWGRQEADITARTSDAGARICLRVAKPSTVLLRYVSLLPVERWNGLPLRRDMAEMLAAFKPAFMRFPGGGFVHNLSVDSGWNWKETIGPVERRPGRISMWGYRSTDGLGYDEYLRICETMKMVAVPVVNIGISCMAFKYEVEPLEKMGPWVQDALDAIEYANGPADSPWGKIRAANGHPAPYNIKYMAIGNECGREAYEQRYPLFYSAIKKIYPQMTLISCVEKAKPAVDIFDHHRYSDPEWYFAHSRFYDETPRSQRIFMSEFSSIDGHSPGNLIGALAEAVGMMDMERNSDVVVMSAYAPLYIHAKHRNWPNSMFVFDGSRLFGTPSHYGVKMMNETRGERVVACRVTAPKARRQLMACGGVGLGTWQTQIEARDVRVYSGEQPLAVVTKAADWSTWKRVSGQWQVNAEGSLVQCGDQPMTCAYTGSKDWSTYTYSATVRKLSGNEGVRFYFAYENPGTHYLFTLGSFGNRTALIERWVNGKREEITPRFPFTMEKGRWYDVKIDLTTERLCCVVDGAVIFDLPMSKVTTVLEREQIFASASRCSDGRIYLRAVNASDQPFKTAFHVSGSTPLARECQISCLTGSDPRAENSFESPERISPQVQKGEVIGQDLTWTLPPYSLSNFSLREVNPR